MTACKTLAKYRMTTVWTNPTTIEQYAESDAESVHIPWRDAEILALTSPGSQSLGLNGALSRISRAPKYDTTNKTWYVQATGYNFSNLPATVSGIEVNLIANRFGRVTDDTVQLCYQGAVIGVNRADLNLDPSKIYGNGSDTWDIPGLTSSVIQDASFGVVIRFQSHPHYPHRDGAYISAVQIRIS